MHWIYFSPHFDDVALSCGGLVWEQAQCGDQVSIWTVCAAEAPSVDLSPFAMELHARWGVEQDATAMRKMEDITSCHRLGANSHYFGILDCIYRRHPQTGNFLYTTEESLNGALHPGDMQHIIALQEDVGRLLTDGLTLVSPLSLGNHVDHQLTRVALEGLGSLLCYYEDFPYISRHREQLDELESSGWTSQVFPVSRQGLVAWQDSVAAHASQISTFWSGEAEMRQAVADHLHWAGGARLWRKAA